MVHNIFLYLFIFVVVVEKIGVKDHKLIISSIVDTYLKQMFLLDITDFPYEIYKEMKKQTINVTNIIKLKKRGISQIFKCSLTQNDA